MNQKWKKSTLIKKIENVDRFFCVFFHFAIIWFLIFLNDLSMHLIANIIVHVLRKFRTWIREWYFFFFCLLIIYCMHVRKFAKKTHASSSRWTCHFCIFHCFNNSLFIYDCFDFDRFSKSFHFVCRLVDLLDTTNIHSTFVSVSHDSRIRWRNENELKDESTNLKRRILRHEF